VITGAGSGIGAAFAVELARRGGRVVCSDIDEGAARKTADAIVADGGQALALRSDVTDIDDVRLLADQAQSWFDGPPTLVINNAGVGAGGSMIGDTDLADWTWVLNINLWGPAAMSSPRYCAKRADPQGSSTSPPQRRSVPCPGWPPTTSARPAPCRFRRPFPPNSPAPGST
jgi:NAD(P)-dependent dehydrogenase (short-subunit alcohol dehydrogenase family)